MDEIVAWIRSKNPDLEGDVPPGTDLIETRLIESLAFLEFIGLLEELSGKPIDVGSLAIDDFRTLDRIAERFL
ncbi:acyl carrier protein [Nonomuraea basaltis]|uniref:acyl carrier protein n=1 Tax=Nonomuraea basaltis TaxID=2495887 RepID=UPI00110C5741|nr:acyl carrier protein [Nonomuraea basaltis]TMR97079.1 acyl carrier protein [Nonomuraea basaltis]